MRKPALTIDNPFTNSYERQLLQLSRGRGAKLWDANGNRYIDLGAGISVNALGYGGRRFSRIIARQARRLVHVSNLYTTAPAVELGSRLMGFAMGVIPGGAAAVHFGNSGAEANEAAIKFARLYSKARYDQSRTTIVAFQNAFHGRTLGALSATPNQKYRHKFEPLVPGFTFLPFNDVKAIETQIGDDVAAIIVEPIQGEGGLEVLSHETAEVLRRVCDTKDILLIADEIQTGLYRTGQRLGSQSVGLHPDIVTLSKPLAGGLPLSATLIPGHVNELIEPGDHGTTFGGGPVTSAAGLFVIERLSGDRFHNNLQHRIQQLDEGLRGLAESSALLGRLRGEGMLRGIEVTAGAEKMSAILQTARQLGVLVLRSGKNILRIAPPLVIRKRELARGLELLGAAISEVEKGR